MLSMSSDPLRCPKGHQLLRDASADRIWVHCDAPCCSAGWVGHITIESTGAKRDKKNEPLGEKLLRATNDINGAVVDMLQQERKKKEKLGIVGGIKAGLIKLVAIVKAFESPDMNADFKQKFASFYAKDHGMDHDRLRLFIEQYDFTKLSAIDLAQERARSLCQLSRRVHQLQTNLLHSLPLIAASSW